ncbi:hypothetical protein [Trichormus variabilis]|uniref:Uncharacterized protein n=1 Tax=Trichormus variabilis SAG 1403-4b TaxID=447716 RepID=A0A3S1C8V3_ANAVA|nr:hypothetical protein [Trichormus variabilis]MBD2625770.1 hypothetical protein [Trichormus variabilis FACHB-164]RUS99057.1 hypothetical protein DSM107003_10760 [Trichormus variabilis SAG 1403-4b]
MFYAKAMYQGSEIPVCAEDKDIDYYSYTVYGLRCIKCGEEVFLKSRQGTLRRPHFAHFMDSGLSPNKCVLRVTGYSGSWSSLTSQGKGQRRKLFQEHFMSIIKRQDTNFDGNVQMLKDKLSLNYNYLEEITNKCFKYFYINNQDLIIECRQFTTDSNNVNNLRVSLIASEAVDYLSILSSRYLLEQLLHYSIYLACNQSNSNNWNNFVRTIDPNNVCQILKEIILKTNWLLAFNCVSRNNALLVTKPIVSKASTITYESSNLTEELIKSVEEYMILNGNTLEFQDDKSTKFKLKLERLNINKYSLPVDPNKKFQPVAKITNIKTTPQKITITYEMIYDSKIDNIKYYEKLNNDIRLLFQEQQKDKDKEINFSLSNRAEFEEKERIRNQKIEEQLREEEELRRRKEELRRSQQINCPICNVLLFKKNLKKHMQQKHNQLNQFPMFSIENLIK